MKLCLAEIAVFVLGILFYGIAVITAFTGTQFRVSRLDPAIAVSFSLVAGLAALGLAML